MAGYGLFGTILIKTDMWDEIYCVYKQIPEIVMLYEGFILTF